MANTFSSAREVRAFWFTKGEDTFESYKAYEGSLKTNREKNTIRFMLHDINGFEDDFEVIIKKTKQGVVFRADCYDGDSASEYPLKSFVSDDETRVYANRNNKHRRETRSLKQGQTASANLCVQGTAAPVPALIFELTLAISISITARSRSRP